MNLIIVRHAETTENKKGKEGILHGHTHGKLSRNGKEQAKKLADRISQDKVDIIYCSDLNRAKETLRPYLTLHKIKVIYTKELREVNRGIFTGKKMSEYLSWKESETGKRWLNKFKRKSDEKVPGGESLGDLKKRVSRILERIIKKEKGKNILILTHGKVKTMMLIYLLKKEYGKYAKKYKIANTGISVITIKEDGNHRARLINNIRHLS